jgi:hypothetical protein
MDLCAFRKTITDFVVRCAVQLIRMPLYRADELCMILSPICVGVTINGLDDWIH